MNFNSQTFYRRWIKDNAFGRICLCVCLSVCNSLTYESIDVGSSLVYAGASSELPGQIRIPSSPARSQGHRSKVTCPCGLFELYVSNALTWNGSFLAYVFRISRSNSYIKVVGSRSRSQEQNSVNICPVRGWSVFDSKTSLLMNIIERFWYYLTFIQQANILRPVFLPRCMECSRGIAMGIMSVRPSVRLSVRPSVCPSVCLSVCLSNECIVTKGKKNLSRFLYHMKEHLS